MNQKADESASVTILVFDGQDDRVELGKRSQFKIARDITLEAWVYPKQYLPKGAGIISCIFDTGTRESGYGLLLDGKTGVQFGLTLSSTHRIVYLSSKASSLKLETWQHVAATFDGERMQVYIDGVLRASKLVASPGIDYEPEHDLLIGMYRDNNQTAAFMGMIAEVRLWNVARSTEELLRDRQRRLTGQEPGLVGYWTLEWAGTDAIIHDQTPHANHGILLGDPRWEPSTLVLNPVEVALPTPAIGEVPAAISVISAASIQTQPPPAASIPAASIPAASIPAESIPPPSTVHSKEEIESMVKKSESTTRNAPAAPVLSSGQSVLHLGTASQGIAAGNGALKPRGRFTIEAWICPSSVEKSTIFAEGTATFYLENGEIKYQVNPSATPISSVSAGLVADQWYHVAVARSGRRSGDTRLYINGVQNDDQTPVLSIADAGYTHLGGNPQTGTRFQGKLLEMRVWRYGRSQAEIQKNRFYFLSGRELGLVRCWPMTEGVGITIHDKTTNRATGHLLEGSTWEVSGIPIKVDLSAQERLTRSTGLEDYGYWYKEMAKQHNPEADPPFRRGRIWA